MPDGAVAAGIKVSETERELALAETRAVLAAAASEEYRDELLELAQYFGSPVFAVESHDHEVV